MRICSLGGGRLEDADTFIDCCQGDDILWGVEILDDVMLEKFIGCCQEVEEMPDGIICIPGRLETPDVVRPQEVEGMCDIPSWLDEIGIVGILWGVEETPDVVVKPKNYEYIFE